MNSIPRPAPRPFSTPWKNVFHAVENLRNRFPWRGKSGPVLPPRGKILSTLWKILLVAPVAASAASPFAVSVARDAYQERPAVRVDFQFPADHHLYAGFSVATSAGEVLEPLFVPAPDVNDPRDPEAAYSKSFSAFYVPPAADSVVVSYQGCAGALCFLPEDVTLPLGDARAPGPDSRPPIPIAPSLADRGEPRRLVGYADVPAFLAFLDPAAAPPAPSAWRLFLADPAQFLRHHGLLPVLLLVLLGGLLLNLTPCVLPMIPINLAIIGASGADSPRAVRFGLGLAYGLGMALVYGALGLVVVLSGSVFGAINASPLFNGAIAVLFLALALAMFGVWQLDFSRFRKAGGLAGRARLPAVLALGGVSALLAGACVAPVLIAVLALSGSLYAQGATFALALPFWLGVGMALPWPLAAAGFVLLPKPGAWMEKVKKAFGVLILLLALFYAWNAFAALRPAAAPAAEAPGPGFGFQRVDLGVDPPEKFAALLHVAAASGRPVLLDFGAHWCKSCKLMDATTLRDPAVTARLQETFAIQIYADQPNRPPARDLLAPFAIQGYPTYLLYPAP